MRIPFSEASNPIKLLVVVGLLISPWLLTQAGIAVLAPDKEIEIMPTCEKDSGNCAHLGGGETYRMENSMATLLEFNSTTVWENLLDYIEDNDGKVLVETITDSNYYVHFVEKTPFWNFPDDVIIEIIDYNESCSIEMHSHSRLGKGDIGVNPDRLDGIYDALVN